MKKFKTNKILIFAAGVVILLLLLYAMRNQSYIDRLLQFFIVVFTFFTAYSAYQSSRASEKSTRATFLPIVKVDVDEIDDKKFRLSLLNIGAQLAQKVEVSAQKTYADPQIKKPFSKKIQTLEVNQSEFEYLSYSAHELSHYHYLIVTYRDIFGGTVRTVGKFLFKTDEHGLPEVIDGIIWEFTLDY